MDTQELESLRHEYSEACNYYRHYSSLRFAIYTVYFAVLGGLIAIAFGLLETRAPNPIDVSRWAKFGGLLVTLIFFRLERLCELNIEHYKSILKILESRLLYSQIRSKPKHAVKAHNVTSILYLIMILCWIAAILKDYGFW